MQKTTIYNPKTLGEIKGPYVHGTKYGGFFFTAQIANLPDGSIVSDDMYEQTLQTLQNIKAALAEVGGNLTNILTCRIYVTDINQREAMNKAYVEMMGMESLPTRALVEVAALVPGCKVEMEVMCAIEE